MNNNPTPEVGLLDDVQPAPGFDMDAAVNAAAQSEKQQYEHSFTDPEVPVDEPLPEEPGNMGAKARRATAKMLMLMADRAQAGIFTLFGAKGHSEDFRFNKEDRVEMAGYLEEGLPEDFKLPWWVPFFIMFFTQIGVNVGKLQEIRAAKRLEAEAEAKKKRAEQQAEQAQEEKVREAYERKRAEREERVRAAVEAEEQ
jgi:hypothetical protein